MSMKQTMCEFVHGMSCEEVCKFLGEIVRCRDCEYSVAHGNGCTWWGEYGNAIDTEPDGFCAWGERKES